MLLTNIINQVYTMILHVVFVDLLVKFKNIVIHLLSQNIIAWSGFFYELLRFKNLNSRGKEKNNRVHNAAARLCNNFIKIYSHENNCITDAEKKRWIKNMILLIYFSKNLIIVNGMKNQMMNHEIEEPDDEEEFVDIESMPWLEDDKEEVK